MECGEKGGGGGSKGGDGGGVVVTAAAAAFPQCWPLENGKAAIDSGHPTPSTQTPVVPAQDAYLEILHAACRMPQQEEEEEEGELR